MIAEGDEKLADFSDEKFPDSGDESSRIYHFFMKKGMNT
jgi:hypothetical protein